MLALGIDVGGTKTALGVIDPASGHIAKRLILPTPQPKADGAFLAEVAAAAKALDPDHQLPVGIGLCELVDNAGQIASGWRVEWATPSVVQAFAQWPSLVLDADVRAAATAEASFGAGRGLTHWIYANAGTGIATVLMNGNVAHRGANGLGMAWGMNPVDILNDGYECPTIEAACGGAALLKRARAMGLEAGDIAALVAMTDARAGQLLYDAGYTLGRGLGGLANMLDPEAIVLGGGVAVASALYKLGCEEGLRAAIWPEGRLAPHVLTAACGADAGLIGAALIGMGPAAATRQEMRR